VSAVSLSDLNGEIRFQGTLTGGGGGFTPVSCVLGTADPIDLHPGGVILVAWDSIFDNSFDFNTLPVLPAGIGFTLSAGGALEFSAAGVWSFDMGTDMPLDSTLVASMFIAAAGNLQGPAIKPSEFAQHSFLGVTEVLAVPAGAEVAPFFSVIAPSTADPYDVFPYMSVVRLA
jgi:hypothetical protein